MTPDQFFPRAIAAARAAGHLWPDYAACEAAEESAWGESQLARQGNNLFGQKAPADPPAGWDYPTLELPTTEIVGGRRSQCIARWPRFPDWPTAFRERMALLRRVPAYAPALAAPTGESFIRLVSPVWATDPERAMNVLNIYAAHRAAIGAAMAPPVAA